MSLDVTLGAAGSLDALGAEWRALEAEAGDHGFFRSWSWVGCLAEERFPDPVLLRARRDGRLVGLALLNRRRGRLALGESGDPTLDAPFVEHNGPLLARGEGVEALAFMMGTALKGAGRLRLSGVEPRLLDAASTAGGMVLRRQDRVAPLVDLEAVRATGGDYLAALSANARQQLRRSARRHVARGDLSLERAGSVAEALDWLDAMIALHGAAWRARGRPGAFANPFMPRFHRALITGAFPRGEVDMLRASAGGRPFGYLYNFRLGGRIFAYQSGFDYALADAQTKPGLTCHHLAIERALAAGDRSYDFLAGDDRYKRSLANATATLAWAEIARHGSAAALLGHARNALRHLLGRG
ncbi:MAG TPA: GNAT family N-acetyltransferase [Roseomonas sp.]|jgi:CelD/BcsL family acetyltransferase involved in cellulose biosynthesis